MAQATGLLPLVSQVLINRGIETFAQVQAFLDPESLMLPSPLEEFPDLTTSVALLAEAILQGQKIAICGDYDADGMTSTALLLRSLKTLGAEVDYAIPSRMREGYGINDRIVEEFHNEGVFLILTVYNGIAAYQPILRARELGLKVIVTDHHDLPPQLPPANAILNPKLIAESSPYRGLAGVGVAYVLAISLAERLDKIKGLVHPLLELFTLGTIADLAPLTGVNRRWVKRGLRLLPHSQLAGVQALVQVAGVEAGAIATDNASLLSDSNLKAQKTLKPEDIGFRLGPRINAVGRIADPQIVIELLTTNEPGIALERAMQCEQINQQRQQLCEEIEAEAIAWCEQNQIDFQQERVLVIVQPGWHHGVIGIVASRLVERYGVPVFIGTYEEETVAPSLHSSSDLEKESEAFSQPTVNPSIPQKIRGSARGIPEFNVFDALQFCHDLLGKYGGHKAAGGFSLPSKNLAEFRQRLSEFACQCLEPQHLKPIVLIDAQMDFNQLNFDLYHQLEALQPCGIENNTPVFWTPNVRVIAQKIVGKGHLKLKLSQDATSVAQVEAIAWRWQDYFPLPPCVDIAYRLRENNWMGQATIELELVGVRRATGGATATPFFPAEKATFVYGDRPYTCSLSQEGLVRELRIKNTQGQVLAVQQGSRTGLLGTRREEATEVDVSAPFFYHLIKAAIDALEAKN